MKFYLQSVSLCVYLCFNIFLVKCKLNRKRYVLLNQKLLCSQKIVLTQSENVVLPEIRVDSIRNCCTPGQSCWLNQKRLCSQTIVLTQSETVVLPDNRVADKKISFKISRVEMDDTITGFFVCVFVSHLLLMSKHRHWPHVYICKWC